MSVNVEIWSDIACPWCYIGKRRFEQAVAEHGGDVAVEYRSFELSPGTPVDFEGHHATFLKDHLNVSDDQAQQMLAQVTEIAASVGLSYDYDALKTTNTRLAHQLLHFAKARGRQVELKERLLSAYFEQGRHVGDLDELADLAAEVGLDRDEARAALAAGDHADDVQADIDQARAYGIGGVPFFVLNGKLAVSGAQPPETFLAALQQAEQQA